MATIDQVLVSAASAAGGAAVKYAADWLSERGGPFTPMVTRRQRGIAGIWTGTGEDQYVANQKAHVRMSATFVMKISGRAIRGDVVIKVGEPWSITDHLVMKGGFFDGGNHVQFSYTSKDTSRVQYGVVLLELDDTGRKLDGHYAGYSPTRNCLIVGEFHLTKAASD